MNIGCLRVVCFANFSGKHGERDDLNPMEINPNTWESIWEYYKPSVVVPIDLSGVETFQVLVNLTGLKGFSRKALNAQVSILSAIQDLAELVGSSNVENPLSRTNDIFNHPEMGRIQKAAGPGKKESVVVDLLSMVDIGEDEDDSLGLNHLAAFFEGGDFDGSKREKVLFDLTQLENEILDQIQKHADFQELQASWQALKSWARKSDHMKLEFIDCASDELCDAFYMNYVKPDTGEARPLDLAFSLYQFDHSEDSRHTLYYIGKMAESISVPFLGNASPALFGAKTVKRMSHIQDFSGKLAGPEYAKWRKLRDESGSQWVFLFLNAFTMTTEDDSSWIPASAWAAELIHTVLKADQWPGELLGPIGRMDFGETVQIEWNEKQVNDIGYNGLATINSDGDAIRLSSMMSLSSLKIPSQAQASSAALVPFTLSYRFLSGLFARTFLDDESGGSIEQRLMDRFDMPQESITREEGEQGPILKISPPFSIFGVKPDFLLG